MEITEFIMSAGEVFSNPFLYITSLSFVLIYLMYKSSTEREIERNKEKNKLINDVREDLKASRRQLGEAQNNNLQLAKTIKVQMNQHESAIKEIINTLGEIRNDVNNLEDEVSIVQKEIQDFRKQYEINSQKTKSYSRNMSTNNRQSS